MSCPRRRLREPLSTKVPKVKSHTHRRGNQESYTSNYHLNEHDIGYYAASIESATKILKLASSGGPLPTDQKLVQYSGTLFYVFDLTLLSMLIIQVLGL